MPDQMTLDESSYRGRSGRSWKSRLGYTLLAVAAVGLVALCLKLGAPAKNPQREHLEELVSKSTAHAFVIPAYETCMDKANASSYACIRKIAVAAKERSITNFQVIQVFRDYGVDVTSLQFPSL